MKKHLSILLILVSFYLSTVAQETVLKYVNPFIGSSNFGTTNPGAITPYGMVSFSPFNTQYAEDNILNQDNSWCSTPFVYENKSLAGFSHINLSGVGCPDFGSLLLMATTGEREVNYTKYASSISNQKASPNYYSCILDKYNISVEATTTKRVAYSKFSFPKGKGNIILNLGTSLSNESGALIRKVSDSRIEGFKLMGAFCYGAPQSVVPIYFVMEIDKKSSISYFKKQETLPSKRGEFTSNNGGYQLYDLYSRDMVGSNIGAVLSFNNDNEATVNVRMAISFTSIENARENLDKEPLDSFDTARAAGEKQWADILSKVKVTGENEEEKTIFYTALYHSQIHPNDISDINGDYTAMSGYEILKTTDTINGRLSMMSIWDIYRLNTALNALLYPKRAVGIGYALLDMYKESGNLPKFEIGSKEFLVMEGDGALAILSESILRGMPIYDRPVYEAMLKNATTRGEDNPIRPDNDFYLKKGYIPFEKDYDNSVSQALEYYACDYSFARYCSYTGRDSMATILQNRAMSYKKYFDKEFGLLRPLLKDGNFMPDFNPLMGRDFEPSHGFHEGTSWNYSFYIPFDIKGLIELHGSDTLFESRLDECFNKGYFDMTNEPDISYPYYYAYLKNKEYKTDIIVDSLLAKFYKNAPAGLPGNDDAGTLSTWAALSMMGIYPANTGSDEFFFTTPSFDKIEIALDQSIYKNSSITIERVGYDVNSTKNYIDEVIVDYKSHPSRVITHRKLTESKSIIIYCKQL